MLRSLPILCSLVACVCFQALVSASPNDDGQPAKKRAGVEARKRDPNAAQGERPKRAEGQVKAADRELGNRGPAKMATMMMQKFDKDGDAKLDTEELTAMMTFMQERRGQPAGGAGKASRPRPNAEKGSDGKSVNDDEVGGVKPRRPPAE